MDVFWRFEKIFQRDDCLLKIKKKNIQKHVVQDFENTEEKQSVDLPDIYVRYKLNIFIKHFYQIIGYCIKWSESKL